MDVTTSGRQARRRAADLARDVGRSFPTSDLALWAAGATFFGVIGLVPIALVSLRVAAVLVGPAAVTAAMDAAIGGLPAGHGTPAALRTLAGTAVELSLLQSLVLLFPASLYGEGLRRAMLQLAPVRGDRFTGWRGRLGLLPVVAVSPVLALAGLGSAPFIAPHYGPQGNLSVGVVLGFHVTWVLLSVTLLLVFRWVAAGRIGVRALLVAAPGTAAFLAGFLQGFLLFLAIPVEWSVPFGGLPVIGAVAALALWFYLMHVLLLVGYRFALILDDRFRTTCTGRDPSS
jgi:membrane protein